MTCHIQICIIHHKADGRNAAAGLSVLQRGDRMRLALISDIHGNHIAFKAVLDHVRATGVDGIVLMGDYVTDFPGSHRVLEMVRSAMREWKCWVLKGNREDYLIDYRHRKSRDWKHGSESGSRLYAYNDLTEADLDFIESLPFTMKICPDGAEPFVACHSSPRGCRDPIAFHEEKIAECLEMIDAKYMFCGHQHIVRTYCHRDKRAYFVGSVGLCEGIGGHAQFAYIEYMNGRWLPYTMTIPYDVRTAVEEFESSGLIKMGCAWSRGVKYMALTGYDASVEIARHARKLAREKGISGTIPEEIWLRAAEDMGIPE